MRITLWRMTKKQITRAIAGAAAVAALAVAGAAISSGSSTPSTSAATPASSAAPGGPGGTPPAGAPNFGSPATGAAAQKAQAAALAKYPGGKVERVFKSPSGGYEVHVFKADGSEVHVLVSADFKVTGTQTGPAGGPPQTT